MKQNISLRAAEPADLDFLYTIETSEGRAEGSFATAPMSRHLLWEYLNNYTADIYRDRQLRLIAVKTDSGEAVGAVDICDFDPHDLRGFVGIYILPSERGKGYGHEALEALCRYASETVGMHQLVAQVAVDNSASISLFRGARFRSVGKLRSWLRRGQGYADALLFQRLFE